MYIRNLFLGLCLFTVSALSAENLEKQLLEIPQIKDVRPLETEIFKEKYLVLFEQPLDHKKPKLGSFTQRVFINLIHPDSLMTLVTEGYGAQYAMSPHYRDEISRTLNTNQIVVEHRYFLESTPSRENTDYIRFWEPLTVYNAASDLNNIIQAFKDVFDEKWISTGISKGGQTSLALRTYYPESVDVSVPYVAPLCYGLDEKRHEVFLADFVGTAEERKQIEEYQIEVLKRREALAPLFEKYCTDKELRFNLPLEEIFDYCVLEYPFALWQWGTPLSQVPATSASDADLFKSLMSISGPEYFVKESPTTSFFVQAARELGYYGYDTKPFRKLLKIKSSKKYLDKIFMPEGVRYKFDKTHYNNAAKFLKTTDAKMLFIYGEFDPWSAAIVDDPKSENIRIFNEPKGSHKARISTFSTEKQEEMVSLLKSWLY